jgi:anti-sigma factor RsiW
VTSNDGTVPPVDLDLLADYLDDVLPAGPAALVARQIDTDARWANAAERLRGATPAVTDMLHATSTEAMPDALLDRFLAALPARMPIPASLGEASGAQAAGADPRPHDGRDAPPARVISLDDRRRRPVWSRLAKVAAALVVLAGVGTGIGVGLHGTTNATKSSGTAASNAEGAPQRGPVGGVAAQVTASGRDYGRELSAAPTAPQPHAQSPAIPTPNAASGGGGPGSDSASVPGAPSALRRLASGGLQACLAQVQDQFSAVPLKADFALYAGTPAVVVTLSDARIVAVGAECGLPGQGTDVLATGH